MEVSNAITPSSPEGTSISDIGRGGYSRSECPVSAARMAAMPSECGRMSARGITLSVIRLATSHDAADVARLMIGFRDWWGRTEPPDAAFHGGARRVLADPNSDFLLAGDP